MDNILLLFQGSMLPYMYILIMSTIDNMGVTGINISTCPLALASEFR